MRLPIRRLWLLALLPLVAALFWPDAPSPKPPQPVPSKTTAVPDQVPADLVKRMRSLAAEAATEPVPKPAPAPSADPAHRFERKTSVPAPEPAHRFASEATVPAPTGTQKPTTQKPTTAATPHPVIGHVPQLRIDLAGHDPARAAEFYGLVLAAHSIGDNALLGVFSQGRLQPLSAAELRRYASRGRSADGLPDIHERIAAVADRTGRDFDDIGLLYLVPLDVDRAWTAWQRQIVDAAGYSFENVQIVRAAYGPDLQLQARALVLRDGRTVPLQTASLGYAP